MISYYSLFYFAKHMGKYHSQCNLYEKSDEMILLN